MPGDVGLEEEIFTYLNTLRIIDTHEHLDAEEELSTLHVDFGRLFAHYASCDLISAGCPRRTSRSASRSSLEPCGEVASHRALLGICQGNRVTGMCLDLAIRDLYGLEGLSGATVETLSRLMDEEEEARGSTVKSSTRREYHWPSGIVWHRRGPVPRMWMPDYDRSPFHRRPALSHLMIGKTGWSECWGLRDDSAWTTILAPSRNASRPTRRRQRR